MKFALADPTIGNTVHSYSESEIVIGANHYRSSLIIMPDQVISPWGASTLEALGETDMSILGELNPDMVILGTGNIHRFPSPALYQALIGAGIGVETMTTAAACRTYNILVAEGRRIAAALILE